MCGEYLWLASPFRPPLGSSLRVRGVLSISCDIENECRVIPACAGSIPSVLFGWPLGKGHPCVCGEYESVCAAVYRAGGSSLRVRGVLNLTQKRMQGYRVIPACAGSILAD